MEITIRSCDISICAIWGTGCGTPSYTAASRFMVAAYQPGRNLS